MSPPDSTQNPKYLPPKPGEPALHGAARTGDHEAIRRLIAGGADVNQPFNLALDHSQQYFMKASPVRPGDYLELFAEIDLLVGLSACPGGDCGASHSDDATPCHPLRVEIFAPREGALAGWHSPARNGYSGSHGEGNR